VNLLAELWLNQVDWGSLRACVGTAEDVPAAVRQLAAAITPEESNAAYWRLDNHVVVQGNLFEAGPPLVPVLLALLAGELSPAARSDTVELLVQLCSYGSHESEVEAGNPNLEEVSRTHLHEGKWLIYRLLLDADDEVRDAAIWLLGFAETDRDHLARVCEAVAAHDHDPCVVRCATDLLNEMRQAGA
jgi:hypothetical protein